MGEGKEADSGRLINWKTKPSKLSTGYNLTVSKSFNIINNFKMLAKHTTLAVFAILAAFAIADDVEKKDEVVFGIFKPNCLEWFKAGNFEPECLKFVSL